MQAAALATPRNQWLVHRTAIDTDDFPTTANSYDPVSNPGTERLKSFMLDEAEAAIEPIRVGDLMGNALEGRVKLSGSGATVNVDIWACREKELTVKRIARIAITAGTQKDENGLYFGCTGTVTTYWPATIQEPSSDEAGTGIYQFIFDTMGYDLLWMTLDTISAGTVTIEVSSY